MHIGKSSYCDHKWVFLFGGWVLQYLKEEIIKSVNILEKMYFIQDFWQRTLTHKDFIYSLAFHPLLRTRGFLKVIKLAPSHRL